ncbi:MAG: hypothetical protein JW913_17960 [Chitinispirillaceae bacterium]|nr:hypothetical protein [Chitinispirillaceae bacterium]
MGVKKQGLFQEPLREYEEMARRTSWVPAATAQNGWRDTRRDTCFNFNEISAIAAPGGMVQKRDTRHDGCDNFNRFRHLYKHGERGEIQDEIG